ncbi:MAG: F0F1 ATP synthase subunit A [Candidatus Saccharibacteria bacterium]
MLDRFFASGPVVHVAPGGVLRIDGINITNSILYGWICTIVIVVTFVIVARLVTVKPKGGFTQIVEAGVDFITNLVYGAFDDKEVAARYTPYFVTIFFFILFNNWLGLLPFVGEGIQSNNFPLFRPLTGDLSATFAIGLVTMIVVYTASVRESGGVKRYLNHFFVGSPKNPLYLLIGCLEMLTDLTRVVSLSLRLFLNVTIGEIVIAVFAYLGHILAPLTALPFTLIELFIGALQAYIFTVLATMYLAVAVNHANDHAADHLTEGEDPETMGQLKAKRASQS